MDVERDIVAAAAGAPTVTETSPAEGSSVNGGEEKRPAAEQDYVYDLYVVDEAQQQLHIPYIPDNLDDIRLVMIEDLYYTFYSYI